MVTKYAIALYGGPKIKEICCVRETSKFITILEYNSIVGNPIERRVKKETSWYRYFDTWEEAHAELVKMYKRKYFVAENMFKQADSNLDKVNAMLKPYNK